MDHFLIHESGQVLGRTSTRLNADRWASGATAHGRRVYVVSTQTDVDALPIVVHDALTIILRSLTGDTNYVDTLLELLRANAGAYRRLKKVSVHNLLRKLYQSNGAGYSQADLLERVPGVSWEGLSTSISTLKKEKYIRAGDSPLCIVKKDGLYVRRD